MWQIYIAEYLGAAGQSDFGRFITWQARKSGISRRRSVRRSAKATSVSCSRVFNLIDELNVFENVELPLTYLKVKAGERKQMVNDILKRMNISHRAGHFPQQLSGGQQQRVAIARAVVSNPKIILADEPTGNLDSKNGAEVMQLLTELNREGTTIVMVTHSKHDASFAHRIINLFDGSIVSSVNEFI